MCFRIFTELKTMWEEMEALRPMPICICDKRCNCIESIARYIEKYKVMCFLKGLNDVYNTNTIKTQVLIMEPLPSVNRVFSLVL